MNTKTYGYTFHKDGSVKGEKTHLSHSAIDLWLKDKNRYREQYYTGSESFTSPYTVFGNKVHKKVEEGEIIIPNHPHTEYEHEVKMEASIGGVHILGYLDLFHPGLYTVSDLKTSISPWTQVMVHKLDQLPLYQLLVRENYNKVGRKAKLVWLETTWKETNTGIAATRELALTGRQEVFERIIYKYELDALSDKVVRVADEINQDFELWKTEN